MSASGGSAPQKLALDTSAYSRLRLNHAEVVDRLARAEIVYVPVVVLGELEAGFRLGARPEENRRVLADFLAEPFVKVLPVTPDVAAAWGRLFAELRRAGTPVASNDIWIAATAIDAGAHLVTFDGDFRKIPGLECMVLAP